MMFLRFAGVQNLRELCARHGFPYRNDLTRVPGPWHLTGWPAFRSGGRTVIEKDAETAVQLLIGAAASGAT